MTRAVGEPEEATEMTGLPHVTAGETKMIAGMTASEVEEVMTDSAEIVMMMTPVRNQLADRGDPAEPAMRMVHRQVAEVRTKNLLKPPPPQMKMMMNGPLCPNQDVNSIFLKVPSLCKAIGTYLSCKI